MSDELWYHGGLRFQCTGCGSCCVGAPGYVWVNKAEIEAMASVLGLPVEQFESRYVRRVGIRKSLVEFPNGDCVFLDTRSRRCRVYQVRPRQCRTWPFWASNLHTPEAWERTCRGCPGADHGPLIPLREIRAKLDVMHV
jgi:Fe-S-cluster containining protein